MTTIKSTTPQKFLSCLLYLSLIVGSTTVLAGIAPSLKDINHHPTADYLEHTAQFYGLSSAKHFTLLKIEGYQQSEDYTCGPAAVMSLLHYYGKLTDKQMNKYTELRIASEMGTSKEIGTSAQQIVTWLNQHGFKAKTALHGTTALLKENLEKGIPTLVDWIDWGGHWVVTAGYKMKDSIPNQKNDLLFFADPAVHDDSINYLHGLNYVNADRFANMWFDSHRVQGIYVIATPIEPPKPSL